MKITKRVVLYLLLIGVMAFTACEAGLTSNDGSEENEDGFSFSGIYERLNTMEDEIDSLKEMDGEFQGLSLDQRVTTLQEWADSLWLMNTNGDMYWNNGN
ncbi:MAG: hypothetical protein GY754_34390, partial [bacterium]|nr:hypothetical protein [bacterium]